MLVSRPTYTTRDTFTPCGIFYFYVEELTYVSVSYDIHNALRVNDLQRFLQSRTSHKNVKLLNIGGGGGWGVKLVPVGILRG